jgi:hypothetical protein
MTWGFAILAASAAASLPVISFFIFSSLFQLLSHIGALVSFLSFQSLPACRQSLQKRHQCPFCDFYVPREFVLG